MIPVQANLVLVDDHRIVLDGLKAMLLGSGVKILGAVQNRKELANVLQAHLPDLLLLDIRLPGDSGLDICKWVLQEYPVIRVIFLSANLDPHTLSAGIRAGAMGFLPKDTGEQELLEAIRTVQKGHPYFGEHIREAALQSYMQHLRQPELSRQQALSSRELEVIRLFAEGNSYQQIADQLHISKRTVESHKDRLLQKLQLSTTLDLIKYAIREGLVEL